MNLSMRRLVVTLAVVFTAGVTQASALGQTLSFDVTLDGSTIGSHEFIVEPAGAGHRVLSNAQFDVRVLFFNAFRYRHQNEELWDGNCLQELASATQVNRKSLEVVGRRADDAFVINRGDGPVEIGNCVMTFAYWNPAFLQQSRLLNPQDGRYLDVAVERLPQQVIEVRGESVAANVYRVTAENMQLKVWYSEDNEWLALESLAKGGRVIRYELS